jgi:hypothetical protein
LLFPVLSFGFQLNWVIRFLCIALRANISQYLESYNTPDQDTIVHRKGLLRQQRQRDPLSV